MSRAARPLAVSLSIATLLLAAGCRGVGAAGDGSEATPAGWRGPGPFAPREMRLHPLTRLVRENGIPRRVEAHVEFFDQWGHATKAIGSLRFELTDVGDGAAAPVRWDPVDLRTPAASSRAFDPATRTYWVSLRLPGGATIGGSPVLRATYVGPEQRRLNASAEIR